MTEQEQKAPQYFAIEADQINAIIDALDAVSKGEGISLRGAQTLITHVIQPLTSLTPVNLSTPDAEEPQNEGA